MFCPCLVMLYFLYFLLLQSFCWGRDSWLLTLIIFPCHVAVGAPYLLLTVPWDSLIVAFPGHIISFFSFSVYCQTLLRVLSAPGCWMEAYK